MALFICLVVLEYQLFLSLILIFSYSFMGLFVIKLEYPKNGRQFVWKKQITMVDESLIPYYKTLIWLRFKKGLIGLVLAFAQRTLN